MSVARDISPARAVAEIRRRWLIANEVMHHSTAHFLPHKPHPKQLEFLKLDCREALYGGAAGGGKSDAGLMCAAQYVHVPSYAALVVRKTYKDLSLPGAIMSRALEWWHGKHGIHWNGDDRRFTFPSGATITFGYLESENDKFRYQGAEIQTLVVDEATQFPQQRYQYLLSRLRRLKGVPIPIRARLFSNPGGIGHDWVRRRFVQEGAEHAFVPAMALDNPFLDVEEYLTTLDLLDPVTRKQLKEGIWIRDGGDGLVYGAFDEKRNLISPSKIPPLSYYICALDFGVNDQNAITVLGWRDHDSCIYILKSYRFTGLVDDVAEQVKELDSKYHFCKVVGDVGGMGKLFQAELARRYHMAVEPAEKTNKNGYIKLLNGALDKGTIRVAEGEDCAHLVEEWLELPWNEKRTKEAEGFNNHASDSGLYGWRACNAFNEKPEEEKPQKGSREEIDAMALELERRAFDYGELGEERELV